MNPWLSLPIPDGSKVSTRPPYSSTSSFQPISPSLNQVHQHFAVESPFVAPMTANSAFSVLLDYGGKMVYSSDTHNQRRFTIKYFRVLYTQMTTLLKCMMFGSAFIALSASMSFASTCGIDFQHAYEKGVSDGRVDGANGKKQRPKRHRPNLNRSSDRGKCYVEGHNIGYGNASADAGLQPSHEGAPTEGSNERAYYDDGCMEGTRDAKMGMSMAHVRHSDMYDRRFEPYFKQGYEVCWKHHR